MSQKLRTNITYNDKRKKGHWTRYNLTDKNITQSQDSSSSNKIKENFDISVAKDKFKLTEKFFLVFTT